MIEYNTKKWLKLLVHRIISFIDVLWLSTDLEDLLASKRVSGLEIGFLKHIWVYKEILEQSKDNCLRTYK